MQAVSETYSPGPRQQAGRHWRHQRGALGSLVNSKSLAYDGDMPRNRRSACPVSCTLDLIGDRWTLLVVRDLVHGKHRYSEFLESPEAIPTNILADRLQRLRRSGIVRARRYSSRPPRVEYHLTPKGEDLRPVLRTMFEWGVKHAGGRMPPFLASRPTAGTGG